MPVLFSPQTGQAFDVPDEEVDGAIASMDLQRATPDQVAWLERQRAEAAKPLGQKAIETAATVGAGAAAIGGEIGKLIPEGLGGLSEQEGRQADDFLRSQQVQELREQHPVAFSVGAGAPAFAVSGGLGGGLVGMLGESAAVGLSQEAVDRTQQGREFDAGLAGDAAQTDLAFSALAAAATKVAGRVGNLFMFGTGNTMARNVKRGLDETTGPVVADDLRFDGPLLEAETRSTRSAAARSPGMPPGPERDEMLRRAAADLNEQVEREGGDLFDETIAAARETIGAEAETIRRRVDDFLTETTPAQTVWSADATRKLDEMRSVLGSVGDDPVAGPFATRAREAADEAIAAIDRSGDAAEWFRASRRAQERLDALADDIAGSDLPEAGVVARSVEDARQYLERSLADRALFGTAAEMHAGLSGAARDRIGAATRAAGGDLRGQLSAFVAADAAERVAMRAPLEQAIDGFEELARAHERFGTATPRQIETLRANATTLRRGITLADDIRAAQARRAEPARPRRGAETAAPEPEYSRAEDLSERIRQRAAAAAQRVGVKAAQGVVDYAAGPGRAIYDDAVSDALKGAIQSAAAIGGLAAFGPAGFAAGWLGARKLGKRYAPELGKRILEEAQRYVSKHGADTAGVAMLGAAALGDDDSEDGSEAAAASVGGLLFARRFARLALDAGGQAAGAVARGTRAAGEAVATGAGAAGKGIYRASEVVTGAVDAATGKATEALGRGTYTAGRKVGETAGSGVDAVARVAADESRVKRVVGSAARGAMSAAMGPLGWAGRELRHDAAKSVANYVGPRISRAAVEWLQKRAGKPAAETVQEAVEETAAAARRDPLLLPAHTEQAVNAVDDMAAKLDAAMKETPDQRAAALAAFPQRLSGSAKVQREALMGAVDELVAGLSQVTEAGSKEAAESFAAMARQAIAGARTVQDRFRIGMQLTETLAEHTARAGDGEMGKVLGAYTERMWETMGQREMWLGKRELEREAKRQGKQRELLLEKLSSGEMLGIAAVAGASALDDGEGSGAAMASTGALGLLAGRAARKSQLGTIPPKGKAKRADGPVASRPERDITPTKYYPISNAARNEYGEAMAPVRDAQRRDNALAGALEGEISNLQKAGLLTGVAVAGGLALEGTAEAAEPDPRTDAANQILSLDDAATRRIRHTARVLSGLAEPPGPEGLTTALGRFGADHDDPRSAFEERKAILMKAEIAPALVYDVIGATLGDVAAVSPELYQAAAARLLDGFRYMRENLPPEVKTSLLYPTGLPPSESAMRDWATQWNTVMDPESVLDDIDRGTVTHLQIDTLRGAHDDIYQQLRTETIAEVGANFADIPTSTKMQLDILFQADGLAGPMFSSAAAAIIGEASRAASKRKQPMPQQGSASDGEAVSSARGLESIRTSVTNRG